MKPSKLTHGKKRSNKKYTAARRWKVVWWVERDMARHRDKRYRSSEIRIVRCVLGGLEASQAWQRFWFLYYMPHPVQGPELWRAGRLVMSHKR